MRELERGGCLSICGDQSAVDGGERRGKADGGYSRSRDGHGIDLVIVQNEILDTRLAGMDECEWDGRDEDDEVSEWVHI